MWDDVKGLIGAVAPTIATALGGPLAGGAVSLLTSALGLSSDASQKDIVSAIASASPEAIAEIKKAEIEYQQRIAELDVDLEKLAVVDRSSAREREAKVGGWANPLLASLVVVGFMVAVFMVISGYTVTDTVNATLVGTVIGYVSAKADQVVSYYFGSSAGSRSKDDLISRIGAGRK
ncbi:hypothetical protein [Oleispirillum naphthae]|uniref:hypothetical protein n=1 Tax=Oleispirillum naphthae TaxID=2838853 RepID=UPI0030823083